MNRHELEEHLEWYANFLRKVDRWSAAPNSAGARELLEEHEALILDAGIDRLSRHLAHEAASLHPLRPGKAPSAAGILAAAAEILYVVGRAHLGDYALPVVADLLRMADGRGSLLAVKVQQAPEGPYGDIVEDLTRRVILQAYWLAERDGGDWVKKVTYGRSERTLRRRASEIPQKDILQAKLIGYREGRQMALDPDQQVFKTYFCYFTMDELGQLLAHPPRLD